jgi:Fic family protein
MIYDPPQLEPVDQLVIGMISHQRERLRGILQGNATRWHGSLRRSMMARAIVGSNSIEGYNATVDEAIAVVDNEAPVDGATETWFAIKGYRDALTYILQAANDPYFEFSKQFLKSLHFMMLGHELPKHPGQWRTGAIYVVNAQSGETVYDAPEGDAVNGLVEELVAYLKAPSTESGIIRGAMAHLNLTMIHPFKDGNGRMARALQTLVIAQDGMLNPVFCSIEEWLGANTQEYYDVLAEVGKGKWSPENNALPWVRFCLRAHYQQAATVLRRNEEYGTIYSKIFSIVRREKLPERADFALFDACLGSRMTNSRYRADADISEFLASRDLKRMADLGLLEPKGANRGRYYTAGPELLEIRRSSRTSRRSADPYLVAQVAVDGPAPRAVADDSSELRLPGI